MLYIIRDVIIIALAVIGLVDLVRMVVLFFMRTKNDKNIFMVVPICGHEECAEILLRHAAARLKWMGGGRINKIICLDCEMDEETRKICEKVCEEYEFIEIKDTIIVG